VISPRFTQRALSPRDVATLQRYFGAENVNDFSGSNEFTKDRLNYYDPAHFKVSVARKLLVLTYGEENGAR
jgi:hypothetical protein